MDAPTQCVQCGSSRLTPGEKHKQFTLYECGDCALQFWWPFYNPGNEYYESYKGCIERNVNPDEYPLYAPLRRFLKRKNVGKTLLDLGMGTGRFMHEAQKRGYTVTGVDFDRDAVNIAQKHYHLTDAHCDTIEHFLKGGRKFDVITMFELIEHLDNFNDFALIRSALKDNGTLVISTPWRGRWKPMLRGDFPPMHVTRWSDEAMTKFLESKGFTVRRIDHCGVYFPRFIRRFSEWTKGYLSFGLTKKLTGSNEGSPSSGPRKSKPSLRSRILSGLSIAKLYGLFFIPAVVLYAYLAVTGERHATVLLVEATPTK